MNRAALGRGLVVGVFLMGPQGCTHAVARQPPGTPPSPVTVTREEPGGDAHNPHQAALRRLSQEPWGWRNDKRDVFHFPLSDWRNWRRVRFWGVPAFVGFRYGDEHHAVAALWTRKLEAGEPELPELCLEKIQRWGEPMFDSFNTKVTETGTARVSWKGQDDVLVKQVHAEVRSFFGSRHYEGIVGAGFAWPRVCVIYGYAARADGAKTEALAMQQRYAQEAFSQLTVMSQTPPADIE